MFCLTPAHCQSINTIIKKKKKIIYFETTQVKKKKKSLIFIQFSHISFVLQVKFLTGDLKNEK